MLDRVTGTAATRASTKKSGSITARTIPMATTPEIAVPSASSPVVICNGRMLALTIARWSRSWKAGSSKRARSARLAVSTTCCIAERATSSARSRCTSARTMPATEATPSATTSRTMEGMTEEKSFELLSASSFVNRPLATSTWTASAKLPTTWRATLSASWPGAALQTRRNAPTNKPGTWRAFLPTVGWYSSITSKLAELVPASSSAIARGYLPTREPLGGSSPFDGSRRCLKLFSGSVARDRSTNPVGAVAAGS